MNATTKWRKRSRSICDICGDHGTYYPQVNISLCDHCQAVCAVILDACEEDAEVSKIEKHLGMWQRNIKEA